MRLQKDPSPEDVAREFKIVASRLRDTTKDSDVYEAPSSHNLHFLFQACETDEHFKTIIKMLDRRLDFTDKYYTSVQTCKALYVIRNGLLFAPEQFVNHYLENITIINKLQFVNARSAKDAASVIGTVHRESAAILESLKKPDELKQRREHCTYTGTRPKTTSGVDTLIGDFTENVGLKDPQRMLDRIFQRLSDPTDRAVVIDMIERRLNPYDACYSCPQLHQALKILSHCLVADRDFAQYWIDNPKSLLRLNNAQCNHNKPRCNESNYLEESRSLCLLILGKISYQSELDNVLKTNGDIDDLEVVKLRARSTTPPPPVKAVRLEDLDLEGINVADCTALILRESLHPCSFGAFSDVYKEKLRDRNGKAQCDVAVKVLRLIHGNDTSRSLKRIRRELEIWVKLDHLYINPLIGVSFSHSHNPAFVSPWCEEGTLLDYIERNPRIDRLSLFHRVAQGVQYLHKEKVIHGDLKPANILVKEGGVPSITDYGLAKLMDEISCSTSGEGTQNYRAPELLRIPPQRRSKMSDVYALGGILYAMHTCYDPYDDRVNKKTVYTAILEGPPVRPKGKVTKPAIPISDAVWNFILQCWDSNAEERPSINKIIRKIESGKLKALDST